VLILPARAVAVFVGLLPFGFNLRETLVVQGWTVAPAARLLGIGRSE